MEFFFNLSFLLAMVLLAVPLNANYVDFGDVSEVDTPQQQRNLKNKMGALLNDPGTHPRNNPYNQVSPRADGDWDARVALYHTCKSTKAPTMKSTKAPTLKSTKAPSIKSTKAPTLKSTKAPTIKSTKAPFLCPDDPI